MWNSPNMNSLFNLKNDGYWISARTLDRKLESRASLGYLEDVVGSFFRVDLVSVGRPKLGRKGHRRIGRTAAHPQHPNSPFTCRRWCLWPDNVQNSRAANLASASGQSDPALYQRRCARRLSSACFASSLPCADAFRYHSSALPESCGTPLPFSYM